MPDVADRTVASLAVADARATRVFHRHGIDFCCGGQRTLADACQRAGVDAATVIAELEAERQRGATAAADVRWDAAPLPDLIEQILQEYHAAHRRELPRLLAMAQKVEAVHQDRADVPRGLAEHLADMTQALEEHMQKEEQELFPLVLEGHTIGLDAPIHRMESEHDAHGERLARTRSLTGNFTPPTGACNTWRALYLGLEQLERDVMQHVHLENNVLFPRVLQG